MPQPNQDAASAGEKSETTAPVETTSTVSATTTEPQTETASTAQNSILDKLGIPKEAQEQLNATQANDEPEAKEPAQPEITPTENQQPQENADPNPESDPDESGEPHGNKDWPEPVQKEFKKRVGKEARKRRQAEERAEQAEELAETLRAQLENTQPVTVAPSLGDSFADVQNEQQLGQRVGEWRVVRDWCRQHPQGYVVNEGKDNEEIVTAEEVASRLSRAEDVLMFEAPRKAAQLQQRQQYDAMAKQVYAPLFDRGSQDYQIANALVQQLPGLANHPAKNLILGDYLRGVKARTAEVNGKTNGAPPKDVPKELLRPQPPIAPHVPAAQRGNTAVPSKAKVEQTMNRVAEEGGSHESLVAALAARRKARQTAGTQRELVSV